MNSNFNFQEGACRQLMEQLKENIGSIQMDLSEEVIGEINAIHEVIPNPAP